ncbi:hypothetical protein [Roseomonas xinghualingensis]|uniref:hypothetical protein n=1 Tax=Roseomonas xinghualingensis TaxID=2986475 RepID=UPI0021F0AAE3|nr:hypothetical protein [Roseomonas sp. SXEYE001]MCV4208040.1 hypothetical protein [Roseomonas sp. SXEYE001]
MTSTPQNAVLAAVGELDGVLSLAGILLRSGRSLDLHGLDQEVATICDATAALSPEQGRAMRPALSGLLTKVEELHAQISTPRE